MHQFACVFFKLLIAEVKYVAETEFEFPRVRELAIGRLVFITQIFAVCDLSLGDIVKVCNIVWCG